MSHYSAIRGRLGRSLAAVTAAVAISGCSIALFPEKQAQRVFTLPYGYSPVTAKALRNDAAFPTLKVVRPQANGVLNGKRIVIEPRANELAVYQGVRWMTDAPVLLRDHLVRALRADPRTATVVSDTSGSAGDITLTSTLLAFQETRQDEHPVIRLYLQTQLVESGSRRILASRDFEMQAPAGGGDIEAVVAAFGQLSDQLSGELADWLTTELADY